MSEDINRPAAAAYRHRLLATVSALSLFGSMQGANADENTDRPTFWAELNWQAEQVSQGQQDFAPHFFDAIGQAGFTSPLKQERRLSWSYGGEGKISYQPEDSDWIFSASTKYGRALAHVHLHQQTTPALPSSLPATLASRLTVAERRYAETRVTNNETHAILDFQAGKDVGLGIFGGTNVVAFGIRFAQFTSHALLHVSADPNFAFYHGRYITFCHCYFPVGRYDAFTAAEQSARSFRGVGPSISWDAGSRLIGNPNKGEVTFDWGLNAAVLFGRQKADVKHSETASGFRPKYQLSHGNSFYSLVPEYKRTPPASIRRKMVVVPNLGGFAGMSFKFPNAKISLGYRADFFFGAVDGGIDTARKENVGFYGPFAALSIGIGG